MILDPAILATILIVLFSALALALVYLGLRKLWTAFTRSLDEPEPETHGDSGGMPAPLYAMTPCRSDTPAPEIGSGLLAGDGFEIPPPPDPSFGSDEQCKKVVK